MNVLKLSKIKQNVDSSNSISLNFILQPSISIELLDRSISFTKSLIDIEGNIINTISHGRKSLLFDDSGTWVKKDGNLLFDVTMGIIDDAEVCELFGLYLNRVKPLLYNF